MKPSVIWKPAASTNFLQGRSNNISRITFHHIVGDAPAAIARFQTPNVQVSTNYVIGSDGTIYQMVADGDTPFSDDNWDSNTRTISIEHAGGNPQVPYTDDMYEASTELVAWLIETYGIQDFKRHRDVSDDPTACPGGLDVERIINGAQGGTMRRQIPPEIVAQHFENYSNGHLKVSANDPAAQNRYEDPEDDEFWYGLCHALLDVIKSQDAELAKVKAGKFKPAGPLYVEGS